MSNVFSIIPLLAGSVLILLGVIVDLGWIFKVDEIIQIFPHWVPMQFNTALCFWLLGLSIVLATKRKIKTAFVFSSIVLLISVLTSLEYGLNMRLGIDEFFVKSHILIGVSHVGRMSPTTSLCFIFSALAILLKCYSLKRKNIFFVLCIGVIGACVFAIGVLSLTGYFSGIVSASGWSNFSRMAFMTSLGFNILGVSIFALGLQLPNLKRSIDIFLSLVISFAVILITFAVWRGYLNIRALRNQETNDFLKSNVKNQMTVTMEDILLSLERLNNRYETWPEMSKKVWMADTGNYLMHLPGIRCIYFVNSKREVLLMNKANDFPMSSELDVDMVALLELARTQKKAVLGNTVSVNKNFYTHIILPTFGEKGFLGHLVAVIKIENMLKRVVPEKLYQYEVLENGKSLYYSNKNLKNEYLMSDIEIKTDFHYKDLFWKVKIYPDYQNSNINGDSIPVVILVIGLSFSIMMGGIVYLFLKNNTRTAKLQKNEAHLYQAETIAHLGIWEWDFDSDQMQWSRNLYSIFGISEEHKEITGRSFLQLIHPEDREITSTIIEKSIRDRMPFTIFHRIIKSNGLSRHICIKGEVVIDDNDHVSKLYGFAQDVTDLKDKEMQLEEALEQAKSASQMKSYFLANMSHEIRTPMNAILSFSSLALDTKLDNEQKKYVSIIKNSAEGLLTIINDILDFSKIEAGRLDFETTEFELNSLALESLDLIKVLSKDKDIKFEFVGEESEMTFIKSDPGRIRQILNNLLGNAVKFTHKGSITLRVKKDRQYNNKTNWLFEIKDTGIGIPFEAQSKIFDSFSQADSSTTRKYGGTGLGLSICKKLIEMMNGKIDLESIEGEGTTFRFNLWCEVASPKTSAAPKD